MAFLLVNNEEIKTPNGFSVGIQDVSAPDSGRDLNGLMHKMTITQKRTISLSWRYITAAEVATIVHAFMANEYFNVTYIDPEYGSTPVTKTFYVGDRSAPLYNWTLDLYEQLTFNIIER